MKFRKKRPRYSGVYLVKVGCSHQSARYYNSEEFSILTLICHRGQWMVSDYPRQSGTIDYEEDEDILWGPRLSSL